MKRNRNIVKSFLEETNIKKNKNVILIMAYGSRINGTSNKNSDLDIFIVTSDNNGARAARLIDGIHLDINIMTLDEAIEGIYSGRANGNMYIESVLTTGEVLYDATNIHEFLLSFLGEKNKRTRKINPIFSSMTIDLFEKYLASDNDDYYYFRALDFIRQCVHVKENASTIKAKNVYSIYTDRKKGKEIYKLKLPDQTFMDNYLCALVETDSIKRKEILFEFLEIVKDDIKVVPFFARTGEQDINSVKGALVSLNNLVCYAEDLILCNHPYANPLYFITIYDLYNFINKVIEVVPSNLDELLGYAKAAYDCEMRIRALEELFMVIDKEYKIDYDDFCIRR